MTKTTIVLIAIFAILYLYTFILEMCYVNRHSFSDIMDNMGCDDMQERYLIIVLLFLPVFNTFFFLAYLLIKDECNSLRRER